MEGIANLMKDPQMMAMAQQVTPLSCLIILTLTPYYIILSSEAQQLTPLELSLNVYPLKYTPTLYCIHIMITPSINR